MTDATTTETTAATTAAATTDTTTAATTTQATTSDASAAAATTTTADTTAAASTDWRSSITDPDHLEFAKRIASPADAVKVALDLRKANSAMVKVPGKDATAEDRAKFNKAIGVPDTVEGYKFELGREATEADKAIQGKIAAAAFEHGVPATALAGITKVVAELATAAKAEENRVAVEARGASEAALRKEWGADYEANKNLAARAVLQFGESKPELVAFLNKTVDGVKIGDHVDFVRAWGSVGRRMGEGGFIGAVGSDQRASVQSEINQLMRDNPPGTPKYTREVAAQVQALNEKIYGTGAVERLG